MIQRENKVEWTHLLIFIFAITSTFLSGQSGPHTVFLEFGGKAFFYSIQYDKRFNENIKGLGITTGIGGFPGFNNGDYFIAVPGQFNYLIGKNRSFLELGLGATYIHVEGIDDDLEGSNILGTMTIGYRRQPQDGGFTWRIAFTPIYSDPLTAPYWGGISIGYTFK